MSSVCDIFLNHPANEQMLDPTLDCIINSGFGCTQTYAIHGRVFQCFVNVQQQGPCQSFVFLFLSLPQQVPFPSTCPPSKRAVLDAEVRQPAQLPWCTYLLTFRMKEVWLMSLKSFTEACCALPALGMNTFFGPMPAARYGIPWSACIMATLAYTTPFLRNIGKIPSPPGDF